METNVDGQRTSIIILGSGYSGSGAVADYLSGRADVCDPLRGQELSIIQNPYGLLPFYTSVYHSFYPPVAAEALNQLEWFLSQAGLPKSASKPGFDLNKLIIDYQSKVEQYIQTLTAVEYPFRNQFFLMKQGRQRSFWREFTRRRFKRSTPTMQRMPVASAAFLESTRQFLYGLVADSPNLGPNTAGIIFNQAGSYWCPETSGLLFPNPRVIRVSRDPRDQFAELKSKKGLKDVEVFTQWYRGVMRTATHQSPGPPAIPVYDLQFEHFVLNFDEDVSKLCDFVGLSPYAPSTYQPRESDKNIGKYKYLLSEGEIEHIETQLQS